MLIHLAMMLSKVSGSGFPSDDTAHDLPLSSLLAANIPVPTTNGRRLATNIFTTKAELRAALEAWDSDPITAESTYGPIALFVIAGITDMSDLFKGLTNINEGISSWNTAGVTNMDGMFKARGPPLPACR